jgi:SAM-dependent methyltransferase
MGSKTIQGKLWGQRPADWAAIQEKTSNSGYHYVLDFLQPNPGIDLLDIGCGSGGFAKMAADTGAHVTGIDASEALIGEAKKQSAPADFLTGEMEELPFTDESFDVVTGFNSFQYAADVKNALTEAKRVLKNGGKLFAMIWGDKRDCEAFTYLRAVGKLMPPQPADAPGPFALSENHLLEEILAEIGFKVVESTDILSVWNYPDVDTAVKGLMSSGPAARAIEFSGIEAVHKAVLSDIHPYIQRNGHVVYHNKFRVVTAEK